MHRFLDRLGCEVNAIPSPHAHSRAISTMIGAVFVPLYTATLLILNSHLPHPIDRILEVVFFFGSPLILISVWLYGASTPPPGLYVHVAFYSLLGGLLGFLFWKRFVVDVRSGFIHTCRLTLYSWATVAGIAVLILGFMYASGTH